MAGLAVLLVACGPKAETGQPPAAPAGQDSAVATVTPTPDTSPTPPAPAAKPPAETPARPAPARPPVTTARPAPTPSPAAPPAGTPQAAAPIRDEWHPAPRDTLDNETYQGWKQYELNCARCHGEYAVGTSFAPALIGSLKADGTVPTKEAFLTTVCAGRPDKGMPAWCTLGLEMSTIERMYLYVKGRADGRIGIGRPTVRD